MAATEEQLKQHIDQRLAETIDVRLDEAEEAITEAIGDWMTSVNHEIGALRAAASEQAQRLEASVAEVKADLANTEQNVFTMNATVSRVEERTDNFRDALSQSASATEGLRTAVDGLVASTGDVRVELAELREANRNIDAVIGNRLWIHTLATAGVAAALVSVIFAAFQIFGNGS